MALITNTIKLLNDDKYDKAINNLYDNIILINTNIDKYIQEIKQDKGKIKHPQSNYKPELMEDDFYQSYTHIIIKILIHKQSVEQNGKDDVESLTKNLYYHTLVCRTELDNKLFALYLPIYKAITESIMCDDKDIACIGIDYEFSNRQIALMQINFEPKTIDETHVFIFIIYPPNLDKVTHNMLIHLLKDHRIYKILHGADSLDIPYMYAELLVDHDIINSFMKKYVDTRFLCEYYRVSIGEEKKCSIYDALLYFGTITEAKYKHLVDTHDLMGPVQDITWNIQNLSSFHTKYALFDVLFLKQFYKDICKKASSTTTDIFQSYTYFNYISRFVTLEKRDISDITKTLKNKIDPLNNYMIKHDGKNITLINIYNTVIENLIIEKANMSISNLLQVNFLKSNMIIVFKYIIYAFISKEYTVHMNKKQTMNFVLDLDYLHNKLTEHGHHKLLELIRYFEHEVSVKIKHLYS